MTRAGTTGPLRALAAAPLLLAALACGELHDPDATNPLPAPSRELFAKEAGPLLGKRCGEAGCHGNAERPFAIFAVGGRRLPPEGTYSKEPISEAEWDASYDATLGFLDSDLPEETTLLRKALAVGGAGAHGGGAVFEARSDPECRALEAWIRTSRR